MGDPEAQVVSGGPGCDQWQADSSFHVFTYGASPLTSWVPSQGAMYGLGEASTMRNILQHTQEEPGLAGFSQSSLSCEKGISLLMGTAQSGFQVSCPMMSPQNFSCM